MKRRVKFLLAVGGLTVAATYPAFGQASGPYQFYGVTPCRIVDTRNPDGPVGGPVLTAGAPRGFPIVGYCNVPSTAKVATLSVVLVSPSQDGFLTIWPYNTAFTGTSNINAVAGTGAIANAVVAPLTSGTYNVSAVYGTAVAGTAHLIIDVTGYFQ